MTTMKISIQDKKDLDKFTKFLAYKATQIIVQSRSGEKINTKCKPNSSGTDWFNLAIQDLPDVLSEAKRALCSDLISSSIPICIEISLRTVEGDTMVLETWSLGILPEQSDPTIKVTYTVYNRMGILLKSLLSVSRITPAYKLSRRQGPDSYVICYRIYMGEPLLHTLGDNYKHVRVGQLCTPVGTIHLSVSYRTKMTISPTHTGRDSIMLKSDHFHSDLSPRHARYQRSEENMKSFSDGRKIGAFATRRVLSEEDMLVPEVPFSPVLTPRRTSSPISSTEVTTAVTTTNPTNTTTGGTTTTSNTSASTIFTTGTNTTTTQTSATVQTSATTATTGSIAEQLSDNGNNERLANDNQTSKNNSRSGSRRSSCSVTSANDDFIMVDLKTPFAFTNPNSDLAAFYRECQNVPQLQSFNEETTLADQFGDLTKQLEDFETAAKHYEEELSTLCESENNN